MPVLGKEPEILCEIERYQTDKVRLTSMHILGSGTSILDRSFTNTVYSVDGVLLTLTEDIVRQ